MDDRTPSTTADPRPGAHRHEDVAELCAFEGPLHPAEPGEPFEVPWALRHVFRPEVLSGRRAGQPLIVTVCGDHGALLRGEPLADGAP